MYCFIDGKLNLCARSLIEFKRKTNERLQAGTSLSESMEQTSDKFEKGMGILLNNVWLHIEALQTTDIDGLVEHITRVLAEVPTISQCLDSWAEKRDLHQRQEVMVFYYAARLIKHIDDFEESRIMPVLRTKRFLVLGMEFLHKYHPALPGPTLLKCIEALSMLVDSEEFSTYRERHIDHTNPDEISMLLSFKESCLSALLKDIENRKLVRPLADAIDKAKRSHTLSARK